jgi:hypothetical protein
MSEAVESPAGMLGSLAGKWATYSALGTFLLYLFGYLTLRFQLSTYGVATSLDVLDERYLFAGSRFLVFLVSEVPNVLLIAFVLGGIVYVPYKLIPTSAKSTLQRWGAGWAAKPHRLPLVGTLVALAFIQFVLRQCFVLGNLLLAKELPQYEWITKILLTGNANRSLYFTGLAAGTMISGALLLMAYHQRAATTSFSRVLTGILVFLVAVEFLLLPVNYGILIASQQLPRVSEISPELRLSQGQQGWLVWESKEALTYLVREPTDGNRSIITIPRKETTIKIVAYDRIFRILFGSGQGGPRPAPPEDSGDEQR